MTIFEISLFEISIPLDNPNLPKLTILNFCHHFVCENSASSLGEITLSHIFLKKSYPVSGRIIEIIRISDSEIINYPAGYWIVK